MLEKGIKKAPDNKEPLLSNPYAGIIQIRFKGYNLRTQQEKSFSLPTPNKIKITF
jgi:hypothetical protein